MKAFIAYTLVVLGVPILVGFGLGQMMALPLFWLLRRFSTASPADLRPVLYAFNGFGSVLAALLLCEIFDLRTGWGVLIIMAAWVTVYFLSLRQPLRGLLSNLAGMLLGWVCLRGLF